MFIGILLLFRSVGKIVLKKAQENKLTEVWENVPKKAHLTDPCSVGKYPQKSAAFLNHMICLSWPLYKGSQNAVTARAGLTLNDLSSVMSKKGVI